MMKKDQFKRHRDRILEFQEELNKAQVKFNNSTSDFADAFSYAFKANQHFRGQMNTPQKIFSRAMQPHPDFPSERRESRGVSAHWAVWRSMEKMGMRRGECDRIAAEEVEREFGGKCHIMCIHHPQPQIPRDWVGR